MCEPQAVRTDLMYRGRVLSLMSKILMPSHTVSELGTLVLLHESSLRVSSVERNNRLPCTEMSFCAPGQITWDTTYGRRGFPMS